MSDLKNLKFRRGSEKKRGVVGIILILIVVAGLAIGGGYYFAKNDELVDELKTPTTETQTENDSGETIEDGTPPDEGAPAQPSGPDGDTNTGFSGTVIAGDTTPLIDFNKADYDKAINSDKLVVLYFFANWCPICKQEAEHSLYPAFNKLNNDQVVGFRVGFNDNQTDADEKNLAKEYGVVYQHTKVFVKDRVRILKSLEAWTEDRYISEIGKAVAQ